MSLFSRKSLILENILKFYDGGPRSTDGTIIFNHGITYVTENHSDILFYSS